VSDSAGVIAVPGHVSAKARCSASPGLAFGMLLDAWKWQGESIAKDDGKLTRQALRTVLSLEGQHEKLLSALCERQRQAFERCGDTCVLVVEANAVAPFTTGLGNAHPTENGFTFSVPHGLPILPGSGVKGVLRTAALELMTSEPDSGWSTTLIDALFGQAPTDAPADRTGGTEPGARGALSFHDVFPHVFPQRIGALQPLLEIDVMTPHQGHYFAEGETPHDYGQPNPILFVTVAPGAKFVFHITCDEPRLMANLRSAGLAEAIDADTWRTMIDSAFEHAFEWLGFGAKTSVGYGAMRIDEQLRVERRERVAAKGEEERRRAEDAQRRAGMDDVDRQFDDELMKQTSSHPEHPEVVRRVAVLEQGDWSGPARHTAAVRQCRWMQDNDEWVEVSKKKQPTKDKKHQRTLAVKRIIDHG